MSLFKNLNMKYKKICDRILILTFYFFLFLYTLLFSLITINRYLQYEVFYYDFGIFERAIYLMSQFKIPIIDHYILTDKISFADHFNPSLILISLIYKILPKPEFLLFLQVLFVSLSGYMIFLIGKEISKNLTFSVFLSLSYLFFIGTQNALIADFHAITLSNLFYALFVYFYLKSDFKKFLVSYLIFLGFKEHLFIAGVLTLLSLWLFKNQWKKKLMLTSLLSIAYGIIVIKILMPFLSGKFYLYSPEFPGSPKEILLRFFTPKEKIKTLLFSFASFGFLPIINLKFYPPVLSDFFVRFVPENTQGRWGLGLHSSIQSAILLATSAALSFPILKKWIKRGLILNIFTIIIFTFSILLNLKKRPPIILGLIPDFYRNTKNFKFLNELVDQIPRQCSVMTQNNLLPHLTHNKKIWMLRKNYKSFSPDTIILDLRPGQNPSNFWPLKETDLLKIKKKLDKDKSYKLYYSTKEQFIYTKIGSRCIK